MVWWLLGAKPLPAANDLVSEVDVFASNNDINSFRTGDTAGFYTKGRLLVKSNLIYPSDKLTWQPGKLSVDPCI